MPRANRRDVLADGEVQVVHCVNHCVRRAFLCGHDPLTGTDYEHRRELIRQRMEFLAGVMGIEVLGYSVMSNHIHCILRSRPDVVSGWSDEEVAAKWWALCPLRKGKDDNAAEPTEFEINSIKNDMQQLKERRNRLSSISWFMRFLCEKVARESNKQDSCTGRFWEGRFKAQKITDEAGLLACSVCVDLNPVRAKVAESPDESVHTSIYDRLKGSRGAKMESAAYDLNVVEAEQSGAEPRDTPVEDLKQKRKKQKRNPTGRKVVKDAWLSQLEL